MLYLEDIDDSVLNNIDFLFEDNISFTPYDVITNIINNKFIVSLEEVYDHINEHISFDYMIESISKYNNIGKKTITFSVYPSSLYLNEDIQDLYINLINDDYIVQKKYDPYSNESRLIDSLIEECIRLDSIDPLDIIYTYINEENAYKVIAKAIGKTTVDTARSSFNHGFKKGFSKEIDNKIGSFLDTSTVEHRPVYNTNTGRVEIKPVKIINRNGRIHENISDRLGLSKTGPGRDFIDDVVNDTRKSLGNNIIDGAQALLSQGLSSVKDRISGEKMINKLDHSIHTLDNSLHTMPNQQKRSLFGRILDKLRELKNRIISYIRRFV